ncbi:MAG: VCBS repeat-containing protein [Planctomycetota bacterium]
MVTAEQPQANEGWSYLLIDDQRGKWGDWDPPEWLRYFGLDAADMDTDGDLDLVSGRYVYENPGGDMTAAWNRTDLGLNADACLFLDIDGDTQADVIGQALPDVYWFEATDESCSSWTARRIGRLPPTGHTNGQGYRVTDLTGDGSPEVLLQAGGGLYAAELSPHVNGLWEWVRLARLRSDEGIGVGDIDNDGDLDLVVGDLAVDSEVEHPTRLLWLENPGGLQPPWRKHSIGSTEHAIDRVEVGDLDADGWPDIVVSIERYPGDAPDASLYWFARNSPGRNAEWERTELVRQYSMNNLSLGDVDRDGDLDIAVSEHKGPRLRLQLWENRTREGEGFRCRELGRGAEMHLGARLFDLDGDGDLDIVGHAWDRHELLHVWRNDHSPSQ